MDPIFTRMPRSNLHRTSFTEWIPYFRQQSSVCRALLALPSVLTPLCSVGYTPVPSTTRMCQINGQWAGQPPTCIAITCGNLPQDFANGYNDVGHNSPYVQPCNYGVMQLWVLSPSRREKALR